MKQSTAKRNALEAIEILAASKRREGILEVIETIEEYIESIESLLDSKEARNIYNLALGDRFERLWRKRHRLSHKANDYYQLTKKLRGLL